MIPETLKEKLEKAVKAEKYFVTVTYVDKGGKLRHFWETHRFPKEDLIPTLEHLKRDLTEKELSSAKQKFDWK